MTETLVRQTVRFLPALACGALLAACGGGDNPIAPAAVTGRVTAAPGSFQVLRDTEITGAVEFPSAGANGASYLIVGQLGTSDGNIPSVPFTIGSQPFQADVRVALGQRGTVASRFHAMLRAREAEFARRRMLQPSVLGTPSVLQPPPTFGSKRTFKVCGDINCDALANVQATAQYIGTHAAIYVDDSVPANGFTASDLNSIGNEFDQVLYPIDRARFGAESDIDLNDVVIVLLTDKINELVKRPDCVNSFITGFFFGADIAPGFATQYNNGEIFYGMVPDPQGSGSLCAYSRTFVRRILPVTFIHEFQHMISFNQHVMPPHNGDDEVLWLNEGLSHIAEELAGMHYDSLGVDSSASYFFLGDLYNAYIWMREPSSNALVAEAPPGTLEERGAAWLFLRYLLDQFGPGLTNTLVQTTLTGGSNVAAATGQPFKDLLAKFALALYLTDAPGLTPPQSLRYSSWDFRSTFLSLHNQLPSDFPVAYPLLPDSSQGVTVTSSGTLVPGGSAYVIATQVPNSQGFQLVFRRPNGAAMPFSALPQLAVFRLH